MSRSEKPIGYWLKEADQAISTKVNQHLNKYNLTRSHWQVLNVVYEERRTTKAEISQYLRHFLDDSQLNHLLNDLIQRKWMSYVTESKTHGTVVQLTEEGEKAYTKILATQQQTRRQLVEGITKEEYETTINVLKRLVENAKTKE